MAEEINSTDEPGKAPDPAQDGQNPNPDGKGKEDIFHNPLYQGTKADMLKYKEEARALKIKMEKIEQEREAQKKKELEEKQEYKTLYEKTVSEMETLKIGLKKERSISTVRTEAVKMGILNPSDRNLDAVADSLDFDETGKPQGVKEALENLKVEAPYLFGKPAGSHTPTVDGKPAPSIEATSYKDLLETPGLMREYIKNRPAEYRKMKEAYYSGKGR